jgi:hypothetical protein
MRTPPVLLEYVPLVRRLLAASQDPDVSRVGTLGEIAYLVDANITHIDLQLLDALIASATDGRAFARRRLQEHRNAVEPYVGKSLLKTGMRFASRHYEIYVDPETETIVHLSGFARPAALPEELTDAPPADQARWIFDHPGDGSHGDGERIVAVLLEGRNADELSSEELRLLAKGYNWWGRHKKTFETAKLGLARTPHSPEWLSLARLYARNAFLQDLPRFLTACDACIAEGAGPAAFWHLLKANQYIEIATGECELEDYEWTPGDPIRHPEFLRPAAEAIEAALAHQPDLPQNEAARDWVGDWNRRFAAVLQEPEFRHLGR